MTDQTFVSEAVRDALSPGDVTAPVELLSVVAGSPDPINNLASPDKASEFFAAALAEIPFVQQAWRAKSRVSAAEQAKLASLIRWLIESVRGWKRADDLRNIQLVSIFVVAQLCDQDGRLWKMLPSDIASNADLITHLSKLVGSFAITYGTRGNAKAPIWEQEELDRLIKAEADGDWFAISQAWAKFEAQAYGGTLQIQAVRSLNRCGTENLARASANIRQTVVAAQIADSLDVASRLTLALVSDNPFIQFTCVYQTVSARRSTEILSKTNQQLLAALLSKIAADEPRWESWMRIFNKYPQRYPLLQGALGQALAHVSKTAQEAYVNVLQMTPTPINSTASGRAIVADCLRSFGANANAGQRAVLWSFAYGRWKDWRFGAKDPNQHLFNINWSPLDYAIVGYARESLSPTQRQVEMAILFAELREIDSSWYASISDLHTAWYRLISQFQPFAHADYGVELGQDWLTPNLEYWPFNRAKEPYLCMKFGVVVKDIMPTTTTGAELNGNTSI